MKRGKAFCIAGADCVFVPDPVPENDIISLVENIPAPIKILATPVTSNLNSLEQLGVRRLSVGSTPATAIYSNLIDIAYQIQTKNKTEKLLKHNFSYDVANEFFFR